MTEEAHARIRKDINDLGSRFLEDFAEGDLTKTLPRHLYSLIGVVQRWVAEEAEEVVPPTLKTVETRDGTEQYPYVRDGDMYEHDMDDPSDPGGARFCTYLGGSGWTYAKEGALKNCYRTHQVDEVLDGNISEPAVRNVKQTTSFMEEIEDVAEKNDLTVMGPISSFREADMVDYTFADGMCTICQAEPVGLVACKEEYILYMEPRCVQHMEILIRGVEWLDNQIPKHRGTPYLYEPKANPDIPAKHAAPVEITNEEFLPEVKLITDKIVLKRWNANYRLRVEIDNADPDGRVFMQIVCWRPDSYSGQLGEGHGGKYYVSPHATETEIVQAVLGLLLSYEEHEAREGFEYYGVKLFNPHISVSAHMRVSGELDVREK